MCFWKQPPGTGAAHGEIATGGMAQTAFERSTAVLSLKRRFSTVQIVIMRRKMTPCKG